MAVPLEQHSILARQHDAAHSTASARFANSCLAILKARLAAGTPAYTATCSSVSLMSSIVAPVFDVARRELERRNEVGAVLVPGHAHADFQHVHVVPVARTSELAQAGLLVKDAQHAQRRP